MKLMTRLCVITVMLALGSTGCVAAQSKDVHPMLIDNLPTNLWSTQILLTADQHGDGQQEMVGKLEKLLHDEYRITAQHVYFLPSDHGGAPTPIALRMEFNSVMMSVDRAGPELVFTNETSDSPYVNVWKTSGTHPKYVAFSAYLISDNNTLLGYFELEPM